MVIIPPFFVFVIPDSSLMIDFKQLLDLFARLPETPRNLTFMDVAGYSHYENVCSNILAFYFDPQEDHKLGDLLIQALLSLCAAQPEQTIERLDVSREFPTRNGGKIDLMLTGDQIVVGIENKIYHWIANDLNDYGRTIDSLGGPGAVRRKLLLGLTPVRDPLPGHFQSVTYLQLWSAVESRMGSYLGRANPKWTQYLLDFMQTTRNLSVNPMETSQPNDQFFIDHHESIERLFAERKKFEDRLFHRVTQLQIMLSENEELRHHVSKGPWIHAKSCLVLDFLLTENGIPIALDLNLGPAGWELTFFGRGQSAAGYLASLVNETLAFQEFRGCEFTPSGRRIIRRWDLQANLEEIRDYLLALSSRISVASAREVEHSG